MDTADSKYALIETISGEPIYYLPLNEYEVGKTLFGGDHVCQLHLEEQDRQARTELLARLLGCKITVPYGSQTWRGYISELEFSAGFTTSYRIGLSTFGNRLRVRYKTMSILDGNELFDNRSFESLDIDSKPDGWDVSDAGWTIDTTDFYHGKNSMSISPGGSVSRRVSKPVGGYYAIQFWYKQDITITLADTDNLDASDNPVVFFTNSYSNSSWSSGAIKVAVPDNINNVVITFTGHGLLDLVSCLEQAEVEKVTGWRDDLQSQAIYGILEREYDFTSIVSNELSAINYRDRQPTTPSLVVAGFGSGNTIVISCVGQMFDLNRVIPDVGNLTYKVSANATTSDSTVYLNSVDGLSAGDTLYWSDHATTVAYTIDSIDEVFGSVTFTSTLTHEVDINDLLYSYVVSDLITKLVEDAGLTVICPYIGNVVADVSNNTGNGSIKELLQLASTEDLIYSYVVHGSTVIVFAKQYVIGTDTDYVISELGYTQYGTILQADQINPGYFRDSDTGIFLPRFLVDVVTWSRTTDDLERVELSIQADNNLDERMWRYVVSVIKGDNNGMGYSRS